MTQNIPIERLTAVADCFPVDGHLLDGIPYGSGHINDTFALRFAENHTSRRYILQRINHRVFKDIPSLMDNIARVCRHVRGCLETEGRADAHRRALTLIPTREGKDVLLDDEGDYWRLYPFIESARTYDIIQSHQQAYEAAKAFGLFQRQLADLPGPRLHETIPAFHHTRARFNAFMNAVEDDACGRAAAARDEIAFAQSREAIVDVLLDQQAAGILPERITHNDTKINNVMMDVTTHEGLCVIDLDTVMPGLALYDFGDMMRTATNTAEEDERDLSRIACDLSRFEALAQGYLGATRNFLNDAEIRQLAFSGILITFEIGLRFLTDYLSGDTYFKIHRDGHNLDRARAQFKLMTSMEDQLDCMQRMVEHATSDTGR